jgi:hypothetical protein
MTDRIFDLGAFEVALGPSDPLSELLQAIRGSGEPHPTTLEDVELLLVNHFPQSATRRHLWDALLELHGRLLRGGLNRRQWLGGTFVSPSTEPESLVAVTHLDHADIADVERLPADIQAGLLNSEQWHSSDAEASLIHGCVIDLPDDHPHASHMRVVRGYWESRLGLRHAARPYQHVLEIEVAAGGIDGTLQ